MRLLNKIEAIITPKKNKNDDCALKKKRQESGTQKEEKLFWQTHENVKSIQE